MYSVAQNDVRALHCQCKGHKLKSCPKPFKIFSGLHDCNPGLLLCTSLRGLFLHLISFFAVHIIIMCSDHIWYSLTFHEEYCHLIEFIKAGRSYKVFMLCCGTQAHLSV